ncbi:MAG: DUF2064 domain-containing protein [Candidatus Thorarchaeota archaeon]
MKKQTVIIFTKVPIAGLVKTRLSESTPISEIESSLLAEAMLKDTIVIASKSNADLIEIGYYPEDFLANIKKIVEKVQKTNHITKPIQYYLQKGSSFDERFGSVVQESINSGNEHIVIIGADLPYMPSTLINSAFLYLGKKSGGNNIVIGPAGEGGIYLLGISQDYNSEWFREYKLFTSGVEIIQFSNFCKLEGIKLHLLTPLIDIDIEDDLVSLLGFIEGLKIAENNENFHFPYYTVRVLEFLGLYIKELEGKTRNRRIGK